MALVIDTTFSKAPGSNHTTPSATPTCKRPTPLVGRWGDYAWDNFMDAASANPQDPHSAFQVRDDSAQGSPLSAKGAGDTHSFLQANQALDSTQPGPAVKADSTIALRDPTAPPRQISATDSYASMKDTPNSSFSPAPLTRTTTAPTSGAPPAAVAGSMIRQDTGDSDGFLCDPTQFVDFAAMGQGQGAGQLTCVCLPTRQPNGNSGPTSDALNPPGRNSHQPYLNQQPVLGARKANSGPLAGPPQGQPGNGWSAEPQYGYAAYQQPQWGHPSSASAYQGQANSFPAPVAHYQPGDRNRAPAAVGGLPNRPTSPPPTQYPGYPIQQPRGAYEAGGYPPPTAHPFAQVPMQTQASYSLAPHMVYPPALQQVAQGYPGQSDPRGGGRGAVPPPASHHVPNGASGPAASLAAGATHPAAQYQQRIFHSATLPLQISRFPPPPPPSSRAIGILTAGGAGEKQAQNIALRWYKRVVASQPAHPRVPPCPEPDFALSSVESWVHTIGEWWKVNYAGMTTSAVFGPPTVSPPGSHTKRRPNTGNGSNSGSANNRSFGAATATGTSSQPNSANNRVGGGSGSNRGSANNRTGTSSQPGSANNRTGSQPNSANNRLRTPNAGGDSFEVTSA